MKGRPNYKLKALREEYGFNQNDVAKFLEIGITTYNRKENGISEFTESECEKISMLFNKSPIDIFFSNYVTSCTTGTTEETA